ncbi:uncharacterized protein VP01_7398g1, partial [Puccinia sorghi]
SAPAPTPCSSTTSSTPDCRSFPDSGSTYSSLGAHSPLGSFSATNTHPAPPPCLYKLHTAQLNPAPAPNPIRLAKPQPFDGTCGAAAEVFFSQIALHTITYPERFPTDASKVAFAASFMREYAATWCQLYLNRIFN